MNIGTAHEHTRDIARKLHPLLADAIDMNGELDVRSPKDDCLVKFLAGTVISQQLSAKAAQTIWDRVSCLSNGNSESLRQYLLKCDQNDLVGCGVSRAKARALTGMAKAIDDGLIHETALRQLGYTEVVTEVTKLWGFGDWSGDMVAMFFVKLPDVWPTADAGLLRGMKLLAPGEEPERAASHYSPYRTYLARQVWTSLDTGTIGKVE